MDIFAMDAGYVAHTYARFPVALVKGRGAVLTDDGGREYIDLGSGIAVNSFGAGDETWKQAVIAQLSALPHASNLYYTQPCAQLAQMLCQRTGMKKVFFCNSGAEANECAIKAARKWALQAKGPGHETIITLKNSFHGRTLATLAATGQDAFHTQFGPFPSGFAYADPQEPQSLFALAEKGNCCAILFESIQGEGGVMPLSPAFVSAMEAAARQYNLLLMADEVQTGNGRTGRLYGYMHHSSLQPDVVTTAKGLAGGLPLGACMLGEKVKDVFAPGDHGSTFGGNPVCCAGAISILSRLTPEFLEEVAQKGARILDVLGKTPGVRDISGRGLMLGISCVRPAREVIDRCRERGVLVISAKQKVRLLPPLTISFDELKKALDILKEALQP